MTNNSPEGGSSRRPQAWLLGLGLVEPPEVSASFALLARAETTLELANRVARVSSDPLEAAPLLRKAFTQLQLALVGTGDSDGVTVEASDAAIERDPELAALFAEVRAPLACLDAVPRWAEAPAELSREVSDAVERLRVSFPRLRQQVHARLAARSRAAGGHPGRERIVVAAGLVVGVGLLAWVASALSEGPPGAEPLPPPPPAPLEGPAVATGASLFGPLPVVVPQDVAADPRRCFRGRYYVGRDFDQLLATRRDCLIDFDWPAAVPGIDGMPAERFSVRWDAILNVPQSGSYRFLVGSDDGSRLYLNGVLLVDRWGVHGYEESQSQPVSLEVGVDYRLELLFFEEVELAQVRLAWAPPGEGLRPLSGAFVTPPTGPAAP